MSTFNSHFMNARDAYAIAFETHSVIVRNANGPFGYSVHADNIDAINNYYSLMMQFTMHNDFIDSCAFDSMVELDNVLELNKDHDIFNWTIDDFVNHYQFDMRSMHHYKSLSLHGMDALHNRDICIYCTTDNDNVCCSNMHLNVAVAFTYADIN